MKRKRSDKPFSEAQLKQRHMFIFTGSVEGLRVRLMQLATMDYIPKEAQDEIIKAREHIIKALHAIGRE